MTIMLHKRPSEPHIFQIEDKSNQIAIFSEKDFKTINSKKTLNLIIAIIKDLIFKMRNLFSFKKKAFYTKEIDVKKADVLCLLLHGVNGHPSIFDKHRKTIIKTAATFHKTISFYQPHVIRKGNCSLKEAAEPIWKEIKKWQNINTNKPIILFGVSNGARLAAYLSTKIQEEWPQNKTKVICIAGPLNGTKQLNRPNWSSKAQKVWKKLIQSPIGPRYTEEFFKELSWNSQQAQELLIQMKKASDRGVHFDLYSSLADYQVTFTSALPKGIFNGNYFLLKNEGHSSIVESTRKKQIRDLFSFISN